MLKSARECLDGKKRQAYYEIDQIGANVKLVYKDNFSILNPSATSLNTIFIIVQLVDLSGINKLQFHTQLGHMIQKYKLNMYQDRCYVILSII